MTLYKELLASMLALFLLLFSAAYLVQFNSTRTFLAEQQRTTLVNTANSVGLALTPYLETGDRVGADSVLNAAFDGGYYRKMRLELLASGEVINKENPVFIQGVPNWFVSLGLFQSDSYETILTSGWLQLGKLQVEGHPGQAYFELWKGMSRLLLTFLFAFLITTLLLIQALKYVLTPLEQIRTQALEIEQHHFGKPIPLPRTLELRQVVQSINTLSAKLAQQFREAADAAEHLRERAFLDVVSGLGNRAYFIGQVNAWIAEGGRGGIMLVAVDMLEDIYREEGFAARDRMVKAVAVSLKDSLKGYDGMALARISANEYAVLLPGLSINGLREVGEQLNGAIAELVINPISQNQSISVVGIGYREPNDDLPLLLTKADNALRQARTERQGAVVLDAVEQQDNLGQVAWKDLIITALREHQLQFMAQPALLLSGAAPHHAELLIQIDREETIFHAGQFMPAVEQFKLGEELDKYVLQQVSERLKRTPALRLAVNLTLGSITSTAFLGWLQTFLARQESIRSRLLFEIPEKAIVTARARVDELVTQLREQGFQWGVDQYGRYFQSLGYLPELRPDYVKVDYGYTSMVLKEEGDQSFLSAICRAAHQAGVITIATRVEDEAQAQALTRLFFDGYQGYVSPPTPLA